MPNRLHDTEIWKKDWFLDLSTKQKLLVKFIFDNCDCAGFYKISWNLLKFYFNDVEITKDDFLKIKQLKFIKEDLVFIEDFALFQCKVKSFNDLNPKNNAHKGVLKLLEKYNILAPNEGLSSPFNGAQDKDKDKDKYKDKNTNSSTKFTKPSIEEIKKYCLERKNNVIPNQFYDFYESKNWFIGKNKMKDWQAAVRTWERNYKGKIEIESNNPSKRYETGEIDRIQAIKDEVIDETASRLAMEKCAKKVAQLRRGDNEQTRRSREISAKIRADNKP